jgi:sulfonate transport system substrate-binding protein
MPEDLKSRDKNNGGSLELWYSRSPVPTASGIAAELNALHDEFARDGIALHNLQEASSPQLRLCDFNHRLPGLFREGGNVPALWARANGENTALLGLTWVDEAQMILARPDCGIRDAMDLAGRKFALPKHKGDHVDPIRAMAFHGLLSALALAGLPSDAVKLVNIACAEFDGHKGNHTGINEALNALLRSEVDAIYAKGAPAAAYIERYGLITVVDLNAQPETRFRVNNGTPRTITVDRDLATRRPDLVARYLAVLIRSALWAETHSDDVVRIVADETGTDPASVARGYGPELHRRLWPQLSPSCLSALQIQRNFLRDWGFIDAEVDIADWIVPAPLHEAIKLVEQ